MSKSSLELRSSKPSVLYSLSPSSGLPPKAKPIEKQPAPSPKPAQLIPELNPTASSTSTANTEIAQQLDFEAAPEVLTPVEAQPSLKPPQLTPKQNPTPPITPEIDHHPDFAAGYPVPGPAIPQQLNFEVVPAAAAPVVQLGPAPPLQQGLEIASPEGDDEVFIPSLPPVVANPLIIIADPNNADANSTDSDSGDEMTENFHPGVFNGKVEEDAVEWLKRLENYCAFKGFDGDKKLALIKVLLVGNAATWLDTISDAELATFAAFKTAFEARFKSPDMLKYRSAREIFTRKQGSQETADEFIEAMRKLGKSIGATDEMTIFAILAGLKPNISNYVTQKKPANLEELTSHARVAELTTVDPNTAQLQELKDEIRRLSGKIMAAPVMTKQSPTGSPSTPKRVSFAAEERPVGYSIGGQNYENYQQQQQQLSPQRFRGGNFRGYQRPNFGQTRYQGQGQMRGNFGPRFGPRSFTPRMMPWRARFSPPARGVAPGFGTASCPKCGRTQHQNMLFCPANGKLCHICQRPGHFSAVCRAAVRGRFTPPQSD